MGCKVDSYRRNKASERRLNVSEVLVSRAETLKAVKVARSRLRFTSSVEPPTSPRTKEGTRTRYSTFNFCSAIDASERELFRISLSF